MSHVLAGGPEPPIDHPLRAPFDRAHDPGAPHAGAIRLRPRGLVCLRLYFTLVERIAREPAPASGVIVDLAHARPVTDSGCAALIAIDRLARRHDLVTRVVNADPALASRMQPLCPSTRWFNRGANTHRASNR